MTQQWVDLVDAANQLSPGSPGSAPLGAGAGLDSDFGFITGRLSSVLEGPAVALPFRLGSNRVLAVVPVV